MTITEAQGFQLFCLTGCGSGWSNDMNWLTFWAIQWHVYWWSHFRILLNPTGVHTSQKQSLCPFYGHRISISPFNKSNKEFLQAVYKNHTFTVWLVLHSFFHKTKFYRMVDWKRMFLFGSPFSIYRRNVSLSVEWMIWK